MIAVLDFGSQFTHLITKRVRQLGYWSEIFDCEVSAKDLKEKNTTAIILSGGPSSVFDKGAPTINQEILKLGVPSLGVCYGHQLLAHLLGGVVKVAKIREYGEENISIKKSGKIFDGLEKKQKVWFSHGTEVTKLPAGFEVLATSKQGANAAFASLSKNIFGVQFHPEVTHTVNGSKILENFLKLTNAKKDWQIKDIKQEIIQKLKTQIGNKKVMIGVSGGVDSLVAATLLNLAAPENIYCVFIDTGLMRKGEVSEVNNLFKTLDFKNFISVDASKQFLKNLEGITDPEVKRKTFSKVYFDVFSKQASELKKKAHISFLAQGTIYPDRIEAAKASKHADLIKSHHNLSVPLDFGLEIIEPLAEFYKDEVRSLGETLGIPREALFRHPFPGPGLSIRILGEVTLERLEILKAADDIFTQELKNFGWYDKVWQALAALLPVKSVGVMGDERTYQYILALRAVNSVDGMTADWVRLPEELLNKVAKRITNEVSGVNRVLYDISQKPPATIEYE